MFDDRDLECFNAMGPGGCCCAETGGDPVGTLLSLSSIRQPTFSSSSSKYIDVMIDSTAYPIEHELE
jgi:hypothetical protein